MGKEIEKKLKRDLIPGPREADVAAMAPDPASSASKLAKQSSLVIVSDGRMLAAYASGGFIS